jgi:formylglycine-generating enzyme required for sulfatase activity
MSNLFDKLAKSGPAPGAEGAVPRLTLAAFGKHPGWDDHIPGIGVDTETLAYVKQTLYVAGIGRQVDSGAWEKLEADKRQEGFDHTFLWLRAGHAVLGRLWSSKDGKGRAKYPMVLCVDGERVSPRLLLSAVRPGLENLRDACKAAATADQIASHCRAAQDQLRTLLSGSPANPDPSRMTDDPRRFLERPELGPNRLGLLRVLHELSGAFETAGNSRASAHGGNAPAQSLHFRVPLTADSQDSALLLWAGFLRSALPPAVPLVLFARGHADWLDVVAGEPKGDDFFFLQASRKGFPLASEIPYQLAPNAMAPLREIEARFLGQEPPAPRVAPEVTTRVTPPPPPPTAPDAGNAASPVKRTITLAAGIVVVVLIAAIVALVSQESGAQKRFERLLTDGKTLLAEKKYDEAIGDFEKAGNEKPGKLHPQDEQIKQMIAQAQQQRDSARLAGQYQSAMKAGGEAFARSDFTNALALAGTALSLKPDDGGAKQLRDDAQRKLGEIAAAARQDADYQSALKDGQGAFARGDYTNALALAGTALSLKPAEREAQQLRDAAQTKLGEIAAAAQKEAAAAQKEADYQSAVKDGRAAFDRSDFVNALAQAAKALALKPDGADALQLRNDAQTKLGDIALVTRKEADYQSAMKDGLAAFVRDDFTNALAQAGKALSLKPDDGDAKKLRDAAQTKLGETTATARKEADYQSAMKDGKAALARGDFKNALALAGTALSLKPGDGEAQQLRNGAQTNLGAIAAAARKEADYQSAMKDGQAAFARGDFTNALALAGTALSLKPGDGEAQQLRNGAQTKLGETTAAARKEAAYQSAMKGGQAAFARGDFTNALALAGTALSLKPGDGEAQQLQNNAQTRLGGGVHPQVFTNSIGMEFVWIPGVAGGGAYVGKCEVTEQQYQTIMGGLPNGKAPGDPNLPVANVTFQQAGQFCEKLSEKENKHYTLPTRQQWLSAAGLTEDQVPNALNTLSARGVLDHEVTSYTNLPVRRGPLPVGSKGAQPNGLCDMFGNVREWVLEKQVAGFSYQSRDVARYGQLFPEVRESDEWIRQETGFRCFLLENPPH